jgi:hypothetical protein
MVPPQVLQDDVDSVWHLQTKSLENHKRVLSESKPKPRPPLPSM